MSIIEIKDLKRDFQVGEESVHALRGISFSIEPREFVSIMGTSGSGKSTLLNILGCLDSPTAGDYIIDGTNVATLTHNELAYIRLPKLQPPAAYFGARERGAAADVQQTLHGPSAV